MKKLKTTNIFGLTGLLLSLIGSVSDILIFQILAIPLVLIAFIGWILKENRKT